MPGDHSRTTSSLRSDDGLIFSLQYDSTTYSNNCNLKNRKNRKVTMQQFAFSAESRTINSSTMKNCSPEQEQQPTTGATAIPRPRSIRLVNKRRRIRVNCMNNAVTIDGSYFDCLISPECPMMICPLGIPCGSPLTEQQQHGANSSSDSVGGGASMSCSAMRSWLMMQSQ